MDGYKNVTTFYLLGFQYMCVCIEQQTPLNIQKPVAGELSRFSKIDMSFVEEIM